MLLLLLIALGLVKPALIVLINGKKKYFVKSVCFKDDLIPNILYAFKTLLIKGNISRFSAAS